MHTTGRKLLCYSPRNSSLLKEINSKLSPSPKSKKARQILKKSCSSKLCSCTTRIEKKNDTPGKVIEIMRKISILSSARPQSSLKFVGKKISCDGAIGGTDGRKRRKRKKKTRKNIVQDEASSLHRRARYLLIKMKLELSFIDAYSGDGWRGQSKEKIKPEKELQRAGKQVLNCKLGIRDTIRQLDLLSSEGRIADSVMHPDGSVFHEHIFCAKCKSREAFPDNDIILCDGTCNCAFHQKCLEPPLEKIPPADQGWLCKICDCKTEILEAINAHIGTSFTVNSSWEDIFKEVTDGPNTENTSHNPDGEWPSEDSNDEDYDPELIENSNSRTVFEESMSADASSSSSLFCSSDEVRSCSSLNNYQELDIKIKNNGFEPIDSAISIDSGECSDHEITSYRRQRRDVDYKKLYGEMFGKELNDNEQQSEDEDWGPQRRKRRRRELDADSMMATCGDKDGCSNMAVHENVSHDKRKLFRIPHDAVEKLRQVFAKDELPSRAVKENLSLELGISAEKISKWFKNTRYAALKMRKVEMTKEPQIVDMTKRSIRKDGKKKLDREKAMDGSYLLPLSSFIRVPKNLRKILQRKNSSISTPLKTQRKGADNALSANKYQKLRSVLAENQFPSMSVKKSLATELGLPYRQVCTWFKDTAQDRREVNNSIGRNSPSEDTFCNEGNTDHQLDEITEHEKLYLVEIERLFSLEDRLRNLKNTLLTCKDIGIIPHKAHPKEPTVIYVPVAVVKEKTCNSISGLM